MKLLTLGALAGVAFALTTTTALAAGQEVMIQPINKELTFVFVPKVIHPWYDVVAAGGQFAVDEFARQGIKINMIWDQPPKADPADLNARIEANIGAIPTAWLWPASTRQPTFNCS